MNHTKTDEQNRVSEKNDKKHDELRNIGCKSYRYAQICQRKEFVDLIYGCLFAELWP
jgi:hypothetical protein